MRVNLQCRSVAKAFTDKEAVMLDGVCSYCGSIDPKLLQESLEAGVDAHWLEPMSGRMVTGVYLSNGKRFFLNHLEDECVTAAQADTVLELLEEVAGSLEIYVKELNKYFV